MGSWNHNSSIARVGAVIMPTVLLSGCGPTDEEIARAVLGSGPISFLLVFGAAYLLYQLWKKRIPALTMDMRPYLTSLILLIIASVISLVSWKSAADTKGIDWDLVKIAPIFVGTSYLATFLVTWRIWLHLSPRSAFSWSFLPAFIIMFLPALPMALGLTETWFDSYTGFIWIYAGGQGAIAGALLIVFIAEIIVRNRREAAAHSITRLSRNQKGQRGCL